MPANRIYLTLLPLTALAAALPFAVQAQTATPDLLAELQGGGYVIYLRHAQTESDYADQITADPPNCATQRVLSRTGWTQATEIGTAFETHEIPFAEVLSSEYCRAWQTAALAFGSYSETQALNFEPAEEYTEAQFAAMRDRVLPLITADLPEGTTRVIVGHDDPFEAVTGIYPEPQGVAYVLRTDGDSVEVVGSIASDGWQID